MPEKMYVGFDGSRGIGFEPNDFSHFVLAGVTCSDKEEAKRASHSVGDNIKEKELYSKWVQVVEGLMDYDLRYYVLLFDKTMASQKFRKNFRFLRFPQGTNKNKYSAVFDKYAKHGWLIPEKWIKWQGKFPSEFRFHQDLNGPAWDLVQEKVWVHANTHVGPCDMGVAGDEYPLIRIAHKLAKLSQYQLIENKLIDGVPLVVNALKPRLIVSRLIVEPEFMIYHEPNPIFTPW